MAREQTGNIIEAVAGPAQGRRRKYPYHLWCAPGKTVILKQGQDFPESAAPGTVRSNLLSFISNYPEVEVRTKIVGPLLYVYTLTDDERRDFQAARAVTAEQINHVHPPETVEGDLTRGVTVIPPQAIDPDEPDVDPFVGPETPEPFDPRNPDAGVAADPPPPPDLTGAEPVEPDGELPVF